MGSERTDTPPNAAPHVEGKTPNDACKEETPQKTNNLSHAEPTAPASTDKQRDNADGAHDEEHKPPATEKGQTAEQDSASTHSPPAQDEKATVPGIAKKRVSQLGTLASKTRKKRKSQLADLSAAATAQPVKLNTLEKSKLDWETYKGTIPTTDAPETMSEAEREELEAQTRSGGSGLGDVKGYLHRKEFLERVHSRLDAQEYNAHFS
ncbi:hypothetical protein MBRA1_001767 [Malassezia brasiliensis]|uniref:SWR1-complex protein 5 n=1 Tax=Malassezia brasiliensis TaxID=1821822 RepID=A0AAF0DTD7_9BASI|nr:hypothetical protein MBRA1_001767 [Malassezia brasiliensis]